MSLAIDPTTRIFWEGENRAGWREPWRLIYDCQLLYVSAGECRLAFRDREWLLKAGDGAVVPPACWHETSLTAGSRAVRHCLHFDWTRGRRHEAPLQAMRGEDFNSALVFPPPPGVAESLPWQLSAARYPELGAWLEPVLTRLRAGTPRAEYFLWPVLRLILERETAEAPIRTPRRIKNVAAVAAVKAQIESRYAEPLTYVDFCRAARLTKSHLCQAFHALIGQAPQAYLTAVRLEQAARQLRETQLSVKEIAAGVGLPDANYFSRRFRLRFGITPSAYQAKERLRG